MSFLVSLKLYYDTEIQIKTIITYMAHIVEYNNNSNIPTNF
jgi:hypothetical protein